MWHRLHSSLAKSLEPSGCLNMLLVNLLLLTGNSWRVGMEKCTTAAQAASGCGLVANGEQNTL